MSDGCSTGTTLCRRALLGVLVALLWTAPALAVEIPPTGSVAFIQTTGPNGALSNGDFYTSTQGDNTNHQFVIFVPCGLPPGVPITFALYDPEVNTPNPAAPPALDEIRPNAAPVADDTVFTLFAPGGNIIGPITYLPGGGTNGLWVELLTVAPDTAGFGCGQYILTVTTADDDENAWRMRVSFDPDCTPSVPGPGTCTGIGLAQSALLGNNNSQDDSDGLPGTGDELAIGVARTSYQHNAPACQDFYFFVGTNNPTVSINNFDMDGNTSVTYFPPPSSQYAPFVNGTVSNDNRWNGGNPPPPFPPQRVGDTLAVTDDDAGFWRAELCANVENQYIFEGIEGRLVFFDPQPFPNMEIEKTDGISLVGSTGQLATYQITYRNVGNGAATNVVIQDFLPPGSAFQACSHACIIGNPITWTLGTVPAGAVGTLAVTVILPPTPAGDIIRNVAQLNYTDLLGNMYPPRTAVDENIGTGIFTPSPLDPTWTPSPPGLPRTEFGGDSNPDTVPILLTQTAVAAGQGLRAAPTPARPPIIFRRSQYIGKGVLPELALPSAPVQWLIVITNPGSDTLTGIQMQDNVPPEFRIESVTSSAGMVGFSGQTVTLNLAQLPPGETVSVTVNSRVLDSVPLPYSAKNEACLTSAELPNPECADVTVTGVTLLPSTGESPLSLWRLPLLAGVVIGVIGIFMVSRWLRRFC